MQNGLELINEPKDLLRWMAAHDVLIDLSAEDATLLLGYMEGHDYGVAVAGNGELVRIDLSSEQPQPDDYSVDELIDQVCEWNYEMILDADMRRKDPKTAAECSGEQSRYEAYKLDERKLDRMFGQTKYASEIDRLAHRLAEEVLAQIMTDPQKAAAVIAGGIKKYGEMRAR